MNFAQILRYINQAAAIAQPILGVANYFVGRSNLRKSRRAASDAINANRAEVSRNNPVNFNRNPFWDNDSS